MEDPGHFPSASFAGISALPRLLLFMHLLACGLAPGSRGRTGVALHSPALPAAASSVFLSPRCSYLHMMPGRWQEVILGLGMGSNCTQEASDLGGVHTRRLPWPVSRSEDCVVLRDRIVLHQAARGGPLLQFSGRRPTSTASPPCCLCRAEIPP